MKKLSILFMSVVASAAIFTSCSKDETPHTAPPTTTTKITIVGTWAYDSWLGTVDRTADGGSATADYAGPILDIDNSCSAASSISFKSDGTFSQSVNALGGNCVASTLNGTYTINASKTIITLAIGSKEYVWPCLIKEDPNSQATPKTQYLYLTEPDYQGFSAPLYDDNGDAIKNMDDTLKMGVYTVKTILAKV